MLNKIKKLIETTEQLKKELEKTAKLIVSVLNEHSEVAYAAFKTTDILYNWEQGTIGITYSHHSIKPDLFLNSKEDLQDMGFYIDCVSKDTVGSDEWIFIIKEIEPEADDDG